MPELAAWLKSNEPSFAIAGAASRRQGYWVPIVPGPDGPGLLTSDDDDFIAATLSSTFALFHL
jgi:hypothetical protein